MATRSFGNKLSNLSLASPVKGKAVTKLALFTSPLKSLRPHEPLLDDNPDRFCMFPIKNPAVWEMYKKAEASFWTGGARRARLYEAAAVPSHAMLCSNTACASCSTVPARR